MKIVTARELIDKLADISNPRVPQLSPGKSETIEDLWNNVILPLLPPKDVVLSWHKVLMDYVKSPRAMYAIRGYNSDSKKRYHLLRRGFLTRTDKGYSFFYTDNFHAAYFMKLALDGVVPTVDALLEVYNSRKFPARFHRDTQDERELMAIPNGQDPGIQTAGYKLAHIYNVGKDYYSGTKVLSLIRNIVDVYFPRGERTDWEITVDETGPHFERFLSVQPEAKDYIIAAYLRFVHPFNYFLVPKSSVSSVDVSENPQLISFVENKMREIYGSAYEEFLCCIKPVIHKKDESALASCSLSVSYSLDVKGGIKPLDNNLKSATRTRKTIAMESYVKTEKLVQNIKSAYEDYLICKERKKLRTPSGAPSTVIQYSIAVDEVRQLEKLRWEEFVAGINSLVEEYGPNGSKAEEGMKRHNTVISALKAFARFVSWSDSRGIKGASFQDEELREAITKADSSSLASCPSLVSYPSEKSRIMKPLDNNLNATPRCRNTTAENTQRRVADIVRTELSDILEKGKLSEQELLKLMDKDHCKQVFGLNFPLLSQDKVYTKGVCRYYVRPLNIQGKDYYLTSQWYERNRADLRKWLDEHQSL